MPKLQPAPEIPTINTVQDLIDLLKKVPNARFRAPSGFHLMISDDKTVVYFSNGIDR